MRNWRFASMLLLLSVAMVALLDVVAFPDVRILNDEDKTLIAGGGNCLCRKYNACGSVYCEKDGDDWKNCSGNTKQSFCVDSDDEDDSCDSDGSSVTCGVFQTCTSDQCSSCTPGSTSCSRTSAGSDDDTPCD